jgi:uncharacterized membrane protein YfcA
MWPLVPALLLASFIGSYEGKEILARISQSAFRKILLILVFFIGILLILN